MPNLSRRLDRKTFLAELMKGKSARQVMREYGKRNLNKVYRWRDSDPEFAEAYNRIMQSRREQVDEKVGSKPQDNPTDPKEVFLFYFNQTDDRLNAAERAGIMLSQVFDWLDADSSEYDENFLRRFNEVELKQAVRIEDDMRRKALIEGKDDAQKFLLPTLPIIGDKYKKTGAKAENSQNFLAITFTHAGREDAERVLLDVLGGEKAITAESVRALKGDVA